jgi:hypothetical protein
MFTLLREGAGVLEVSPAEARRVEQHFDALRDRVAQLKEDCHRVFVAFPELASASTFRRLYRERVGPLSDQDWERDPEVIVKFRL